MSHKKIFNDLKVVELAGVLAGPSVGYFFSELGAQVIKIENPKTKGDVTRSWKLRSENPSEETSAYYWSVNAGKQVLFLDLEHSSDFKKFITLIKDADILITNFKNGDEKKLKVQYQALSAVNPTLIYASITGFGVNSPRTAYDLILQAESGFMFMNGELGSKGIKMPVAIIDLLAGHQLKEAVLIALLKRFKTKKGSHISVSLFDSAVAALANQATNWLIASHLPQPQGSLHPNIAPYGELFDTKDKKLVTFAIGSNKQFHALCRVIQYPGLSSEPKYFTNQKRVTNRSDLYHLLYDYIRKFNFSELYTACLEEEVPIGKIRNMKEVFDLPEAKKMLLHFTHGKKKMTAVSSIAFKFIE